LVPDGGVALAVATRVVVMMMTMMRGVRVMRAMMMISAGMGVTARQGWLHGQSKKNCERKMTDS
jgi:hypothetical protein